MTRKALFDIIRDEYGSIPAALVPKLDAALDSLGVPKDAAEPPASAQSGSWWPQGAEQGDDRFLPVFQALASSAAKPEVVQAMAHSFAAHAHLYGQDASKARIAEFVAQIANETGGFTKFEENLNYRAERIVQVWPSRVSSIAAAAPLAHNPEALANVVYTRPKEGNTQPGDGWRYRGRGALQLTFRNNYRRFGQLLGLDLEGNPDLAADPAASVVIALEFFKQGNVNAAIDRGDFKEARRLTNGGSIGLENVAALRAKALEALK